MLHALHLLEQGALLVRVRVLQQQTHGGDGRLDLVRPNGVVLHQVLIALLAARQLRAAVGIERAHERLILRLERTVRLGQLLGAERDLLLQPTQQAQTRGKAPVIDREPDQQQKQAHERRIPHRAQRQPVEPEYECEHGRVDRERDHDLAVFPHIGTKHILPPHSMR